MVKSNLVSINIFHENHGLEFKTGLIEEILEPFDLQKSLSLKRTPYDNSVAESTFKLVKIASMRNQTFKNNYKSNYPITLTGLITAEYILQLAT